MAIRSESALGRLIAASRTRPWIRVTVSPWWAKVLIAAGARKQMAPVGPPTRFGAPRTAVHGADARVRPIVAFDVHGWGAQLPSDDVQAAVHGALFDILRSAFVGAGISWESSRLEDRGDGALVLPPSETPLTTIVGPLASEVSAVLRRYNGRAGAARIRLRMAVSTGRVDHDVNGLTGRSLIHVFRMLEAPGFQRAVRASGADFGVVVSERLYREVIEPSVAGADLGTYEAVEVEAESAQQTAWMQVRVSDRKYARG